MKITLGTLKDQGEELAAFLEPRVGTKPAVSGGTLEVEDGSIRGGVRPRHVKTYVKRFLYTKGIKKNYRVFVSGTELTIQEIELSEEEEEEKKKEKKSQEEVEEKPVKEEEPEGKKKEEPAPEKSPEQPKQEKKAAPKKLRAKKKAESGD